jgi:hypothetical protein
MLNTMFGSQIEAKLTEYIKGNYHLRPYYEELGREIMTLKELIAFVREYGTDDEIHEFRKKIWRGRGEADVQPDDFVRRTNIERAEAEQGWRYVPSGLPHGVPETGASLDEWSDRPHLRDEEEFANNRIIEAREATQSWVSGEGPPQLILLGFTGTGKSTLAEIAAKAILHRGDHILYRTEAEMSAEIHRAINTRTVDDVVKAFSEVPHLVVDDLLTVGGLSAFYQGNRDAIFNNRWAKAGLAVDDPCRTLITSNVKFGEWPRRIASRMGDIAKSKAVVINAPDWRVTGK